MFSHVYTRNVLEPAYDNWKAMFAEDILAVHKAHLVGLVEQGIISMERGSKIARAMQEMQIEFEYPESIPPNVEDLYFVYERELGARIGEENAAYLHTARSRNDMDITVFRMALRRALIEFAGHAIGLVDELVSRPRASPDALTILYTHGQPANVSTMAHYLTAFAGELIDDIIDIVAAIGAVNVSPMGACAITGTGFPLDRSGVARRLGFPAFIVNTYQAISTSHWLTRPASAMETLLQDCTRLVADLSHKASCEVGIVTFPDELVQASSIMPQKRNPVILEHARIQAGLALGTIASIRELYRNVAYQDVNEAADAPVSALLRTLPIAASALDLMKEIVRNIGTDEDKVRSMATTFGVTTTELADTLVREAGIGFRSAHEICSRYVRSGNDLGALRAAFLEIAGSVFPFSDSRVADILTPDRFVAVRSLSGGPSPQGMAPVYGQLESAKAALRTELLAASRAISEAGARLEADWLELAR
jgi:argininosuccinate lyase